MNEIATRDNSVAEYTQPDPTGGRLVSWAEAAHAANQLARALVNTTFVPKHFKGNEGDATAAILMGDELGLSPLAAFRSIYVVHGTPALYARGMVALAQSRGHEIWTVKSTETEVTVHGRRRGSDQVEKSTWTIQRAQKAGYTGNAKYQTNPEEMLYSKAAAEVCRKIAADALAGVPYSVEDLELEESPTTTVTRSKGTTKISRKKVESEHEPEPTDVSDAETIPDEPDTEAPAQGGITKEQSKKLHASFGELGIADRDDRLAYAAKIVDRELASSADLTKAEASTVIEALVFDLEQHVYDLEQQAEQVVADSLPIDGEVQG